MPHTTYPEPPTSGRSRKFQNPGARETPRGVFRPFHWDRAPLSSASPHHPGARESGGEIGIGLPYRLPQGEIRVPALPFRFRRDYTRQARRVGPGFELELRQLFATPPERCEVFGPVGEAMTAFAGEIWRAIENFDSTETHRAAEECAVASEMLGAPDEVQVQNVIVET